MRAFLRTGLFFTSWARAPGPPRKPGIPPRGIMWDQRPGPQPGMPQGGAIPCRSIRCERRYRQNCMFWNICRSYNSRRCCMDRRHTRQAADIEWKSTPAAPGPPDGTGCLLRCAGPVGWGGLPFAVRRAFVWCLRQRSFAGHAGGGAWDSGPRRLAVSFFIRRRPPRHSPLPGPGLLGWMSARTAGAVLRRDGWAAGPPRLPSLWAYAIMNLYID